MESAAVGDAMVCPSCGQETGAVWQRLRDIPGAAPAYMLDHRRAGGGRCRTIRGEWLDPDICTRAAETAILNEAASRSVRDPDRATA